MLQLQMLLEHAANAGIRLVDFGMGDSPQKEKAGGIGDCDLVRVELYRSRTVAIEGKAFLAAHEYASPNQRTG